jgi:hypothetical protein
MPPHPVAPAEPPPRMHDRLKVWCSFCWFVLLLGAIVTLIATGIFQALALSIGQLGFGAHLIFLLFYTMVGLPFGWG